jgi:hypothetical protein
MLIWFSMPCNLNDKSPRCQIIFRAAGYGDTFEFIRNDWPIFVIPAQAGIYTMHK